MLRQIAVLVAASACLAARTLGAADAPASPIAQPLSQPAAAAPTALQQGQAAAAAASTAQVAAAEAVAAASRAATAATAAASAAAAVATSAAQSSAVPVQLAAPVQVAAPAAAQAANAVVAPAATAAAAAVVPGAAVGTHGVATGHMTWAEWLREYWSHSLLAGLTFAALVKACCLASNVLVQLSPLPQVSRWQHRGCTGEADGAPYVSIAFGGWQWCYYGSFAYFWTQRSGFLILVQSNFLGALLGTYYLHAFHRNCRHDKAQGSLKTYFTVVAALVLLQTSALVVLPGDRALFLTGLIASFCSFLGALSMLVTVPAVLAQKNSRSIPGPLVTANFFSALVWCLCGWMLSDPLVIGPNVVATVSSGICLYLKQMYPSDDEAPLLDCEKEMIAEAAASEGTPLVQVPVSTYTNFEAAPPPPAKCEKPSRPSAPSPKPAMVSFKGETGGTW